MAGSVFLTSYCSTTCSLKMCLTTVTTYSVSASVSSTGADDLSTLPNSFISGMSISSCAYRCAWAVAVAAASAPPVPPPTAPPPGAPPPGALPLLAGPRLGALSVGAAAAAVSFLVLSSASACSRETTGTLETSKGAWKVSLLSDVTYMTSCCSKYGSRNMFSAWQPSVRTEQGHSGGGEGRRGKPHRS